MAWEPCRGETVVGDVRALRGATDRDLFAYLPPCAASRAFWWTGDDRWFEPVAQSVRPDARSYIDVGDSEMRTRGFDEGSPRAVLEPGGAHFETDWARRLSDALALPAA